MQDDGVTPHRDRGKVGFGEVLVAENTALFGRTVNDLEVVPVEVKGMAAWIQIVDYDLHNLVLLQNYRVRVATVDDGVGRVSPRRQDGVQRGNRRVFVADVVEEGTCQC